ncbi:hypothetical protein CLOM_g6548 [Closterium sp. NIES-68]|nr:hypothetical protein CLOM_g6548 [Closterium sp. NIES-68]
MEQFNRLHSKEVHGAYTVSSIRRISCPSLTTMLSSLDAALESASGPRTAAFQPKLKPRARKGGAGGGASAEAPAPAGQVGPFAGPSGGRTAPPGGDAGIAQVIAPPVRATATAATVAPGRTSAPAQRPLPPAASSAPLPPSQSAAPEAIGLGAAAPSPSVAVAAGPTHQAEGFGSGLGGFGAPSATAAAAASTAATAATVGAGARASSASAPATAPTAPSSHAPAVPSPQAPARPPPRAPAPSPLVDGLHSNAAAATAAGAAAGSAQGAADAAVRGNGRGREKEKGASGGDKSRGVIGSGTKGVFFPHSFRKGRRRSQVTPELLAAEDLSGFTIQQIIQRAEVLDREKEKEEQEKKRIEEEVERNRRKLARRRGEPLEDGSEGPAASAPASNPPPTSASGGGGGSFAPQVTVIDGRIVVNEASLTVDAQGGRDEGMEGYRRVEESTARLNYGTHMKREKSDRWTADETTQWYLALQQFGTDFEMLQALFPKRSRRQMKAKFKREETLHPHLVTHALTHRRTDKEQYERLASALNPQLALEVRAALASPSATHAVGGAVASAGAVVVRGREEGARQRVRPQQQPAAAAAMRRPGEAVAAATAAAATALHNAAAPAAAGAGAGPGAAAADAVGSPREERNGHGKRGRTDRGEGGRAWMNGGVGEEGEGGDNEEGYEEDEGMVEEGEYGEGGYGEGDYGVGTDGAGEHGIVTQESVAVTPAEGDYGEAEEYGEGEEAEGTIGYEDPFAAYGGEGDIPEDPLGGYA